MSAIINEFDEEKKEVVTDFEVSTTEHATQIKKRSPQKQIAWESDLAALLQKQHEAYNLAIMKAFMHTQPSGFMNMEYIGNVPKMRSFLHEKYGISVDSTGTVHIKPTGSPEDKMQAVYLSILELQQQSAVPIINTQGGTVEEHITLLKALLSADCSIPLDRLYAIIPGIKEYARGMPKEAQDDLEALIDLTKVNSILHNEQQTAEKPLSQAERRAELMVAVHKLGDYTKVLLKKLESNDAQMEAVGKSLEPKPAERSLGWTQLAKGTTQVKVEPETRAIHAPRY
jgi:hypothetical protein